MGNLIGLFLFGHHHHHHLGGHHHGCPSHGHDGHHNHHHHHHDGHHHHHYGHHVHDHGHHHGLSDKEGRQSSDTNKQTKRNFYFNFFWNQGEKNRTNHKNPARIKTNKESPLLYQPMKPINASSPMS